MHRAAPVAELNPALPRRRLLVALGGGLSAALLLPAGPAQAFTHEDQRRPWPARQPTPALLLRGPGDAPWRLDAMRGRPLLLNFWASWCEPCRAEMPSLERLQQRHADDGLLVLAVNFRESDAAVRRFVEGTGLRLPVLHDTDGAAARALGVRIFPTTVAVSRYGRAVFSVVGEADWDHAVARKWIHALI